MNCWKYLRYLQGFVVEFGLANDRTGPNSSKPQNSSLGGMHVSLKYKARINENFGVTLIHDARSDMERGRLLHTGE
jgi:hypothetical protein